MTHPKYIRSAECRLGVLGIPTGYIDSWGDPMHVGDIVTLTHITQHGAEVDHYGIAPVVSDEFTTFSDGTVERKKGDAEYFVMGCKGVDMDDENSGWMFRIVKKYHETVDGENWSTAKFNYSND